MNTRDYEDGILDGSIRPNFSRAYLIGAVEDYIHGWSPAALTAATYATAITAVCEGLELGAADEQFLSQHFAARAGA